MFEQGMSPGTSHAVGLCTKISSIQWPLTDNPSTHLLLALRVAVPPLTQAIHSGLYFLIFTSRKALFSMSNSEKDFGAQIIDDVKSQQVVDAAPMPESLRTMTAEELSKLEKKMVRKLD